MVNNPVAFFELLHTKLFFRDREASKSAKICADLEREWQAERREKRKGFLKRMNDWSARIRKDFDVKGKMEWLAEMERSDREYERQQANA